GRLCERTGGRRPAPVAAVRKPRRAAARADPGRQRGDPAVGLRAPRPAPAGRRQQREARHLRRPVARLPHPRRHPARFRSRAGGNRQLPEPMTGKRERNKQANRQAILDAAQKIFLARGYDAVTIRDVIGETELASGTFYNYFRTKEDLLRELV